ncbi:SOS response-associated peptidase [Flagellatimonas centrodinii]|uniref:SOS response-associated peptidase n=1 Tax=Flagellatimonas centrodinii TaxID=2806210 RepID=UPI001FFC247E|nr:SOS response-associated peptidase family protein [Flagellatimonas centrodinii]ULQ45980.1 SOS response-associated peptidase [Flagellatimonas centrodinii]
MADSSAGDTLDTMCANYEAAAAEILRKRGYAVHVLPASEPREVYPGQIAPVITSQDPRAVQYGCFGLMPHWAKPNLFRSTYNARSETVSAKPSFRAAWRAGNLAVIPVAAIYEPCYESGRAVRWRIGRADHRPFGLAGIWDRRLDDPGDAAWSFSLLTIDATGHSLMSRFHGPEDEKRSIVVLDDDDWDTWLMAKSDSDRRALLRPMDPEVMTATPSPRPPRAADRSRKTDLTI